MPPTVQSHPHYIEKGYDSEYTSDFDKFDSDHHQDVLGNSFTDSEQKTRFTGRSRTSSGRRSKKSSSSSKELVRILLAEKLDADRMHSQLEHAYDVLRAESRRATDAERTVLEAAERLKGVQHARVAAQQEAVRVQAELRMYKIQYEHAQAQLLRANDMISQSDQERERAERAAEKMRKAVEKMKEVELARRAREEGLRMGREEVLRERLMNGLVHPAPVRTREEDRFPLNEDATEVDEETPPSVTATRTLPREQQPFRPPPLGPDLTLPSLNEQAPLPVPPPASVPVMSRDPARSARYRSATTPIPRESILSYAPQQASRYNPSPHFSAAHQQKAPMPEPNMRTAPDHIIVRSPIPVPAQNMMNAAPPRPPSTQTSRPLSRAAVISQHDPHRHSTHSQRSSQPSRGYHQHHHHHPQRHHSIDVPEAAESASRIYSQDFSSGDDFEFPMRAPSRAAAAAPRHGYVEAQRGGTGPGPGPLPQQEVIVPLPAPGQTSLPPRPPSARPVSSAAYARQRRGSVSSSTTTSSVRTEPAAFPQPSRITQLRHTGRKWSSESSVPGITIEPPSRPESTETIMTGVTLPAHLPPFEPSPLSMSPVSPPTPSAVLQAHGSGPARPMSRTGFRYGSGSQTGIGIGSPTGVASATGRHVSAPIASNPGGESLPARFVPGAPGPGTMHAPSSPGSAADYFNANHHYDGRPLAQHRRTHSDRFSVASTDPNAFHDPDTDPELEEESEPGTPRMDTSRGAYYYDRHRAGGNSGASHGHSTNASADTRGHSRSAPGRPPSRSSTFDFGFGNFGGPQDSPVIISPSQHSGVSAAQRVPLPDSRSASASVYAASNGYGGGADVRSSGSRGGSSNGRVPSRAAAGVSRTVYGNTPFVRSSGLYDD